MRGEGIIFFPSLCPSLPAPVWLPVEGREGGGKWQQNPKPVLQLLTPLFPPQKEHGSHPTRAFIANLALLLPDRAKPSPTRSH